MAAVPITGTTLSDVKTNIEGGGGGTVTSLRDAIENEALSGSYDPTYVVGGYDSLRDFRNYDHNPVSIGTPTGLAETSDTDTTITMSWNAVAGATAYRIRRDGVTVSTLGNVLTFTATSLTCNTSYNFEVAASDGTWGSYSSIVAMATNLVSIPSTPTGLVETSDTINSISMSWNAVASGGCGEATLYRIKRDTTIVYIGSATSFTDTGLACSTGSHTYSVEAHNSAGASAYSTGVVMAVQVDSTPPTVPTGLSFVSATDTSLSFSWNASTDSECGVYYYKIYINGVYSNLDFNSPYTKTGLVCNTSYNIQVSAVDNAGNESAKSGIVAMSTTGAAPSCTTPTGLVRTSGTDTSISMSWNAASCSNCAGTGSVTQYYISINSGADIATGSDLTYTATGLSCGATSYGFRVRAYDSATGTYSSYSSTVNMSTAPDVTAPPVPGTITITNITTSTYTINWGGVTDACSGEVGNPYGGYTIHKDGILFDDVSQTSYVLTSRPAGETGLFKVQSYDASINRSAFTAEVCAGTLCIAPTISNSSTTTNSVTNTWTSPTGASSYEYEYKATSSGTWLGATDDTSPSTVSGLLENTSYDFRVRAINACGNASAWSTTFTISTASAVDTEPPSTVTGLASGTVTTTSIPYTWNAATDNVGVIQYQLATSAGSFVATVDGNPPSTSYNRTGLSAGTSYTLKVRAKDAALNYSVAYSNIVTTCTLCIAPTLVADSSTSNSITVSWGAVTGASSYTLYWRQSNGSAFIAIPNVTSPYTKTPLNSDLNHDFIIVALNCDDIPSADSTMITYSTLAANQPPSTVTGLVAEEFLGDIVVTWNEATDDGSVASYYIERQVNGGSWVYYDTSLSGYYLDGGANLSTGNTYCYRVKALDNLGLYSVAYSNTDCAVAS